MFSHSYKFKDFETVSGFTVFLLLFLKSYLEYFYNIPKKREVNQNKWTVTTVKIKKFY